MTNKEIDINEAVEKYYNLQDALKTVLDERDRVLSVIWYHMQNSGAKFLETPTHEVSIPTRRSYDVSKFVKEMGEEYSNFIKPEHEKTTVVPAKVDGVKAKKLWDMGDEIVEKLERPLLPQSPEIRVKAKREETPL